MVRIKRGNVARKRRKKILQLAKGYRGAHSRLFRVANQQVIKALRYSYVGRKQKKRIFRRLWITRINAASKLHGLSYNRVISNFKKSNIYLNRKMLSQHMDANAEISLVLHKNSLITTFTLPFGRVKTHLMATYSSLILSEVLWKGSISIKI